jgi:hypothetical protein
MDQGNESWRNKQERKICKENDAIVKKEEMVGWHALPWPSGERSWMVVKESRSIDRCQRAWRIHIMNAKVKVKRKLKFSM